MHTMWKGSISFGLVNIPIRMFTATEDKDIRYRNLHKECHTPVKYQKKCPTCGREIKEEDIVRGYEIESGRFVVLTEKDFLTLQSEVDDHAIHILDFVHLSEIDPIYFDKSYYLSPQDNGNKAYVLLLKAMQDTGKIAIAKMTIRTKQTLAALRVSRNILTLETIFYPDEVRSISQVPGLPELTQVNEKELVMATSLIENLTSPFEPEKYKDDYREALQKLIQQKIQGKEIEIAPESPQRNVIDLMEALQVSLRESKKKPIKKKPKADKQQELSAISS